VRAAAAALFFSGNGNGNGDGDGDGTAGIVLDSGRLPDGVRADSFRSLDGGNAPVAGPAFLPPAALLASPVGRTLGSDLRRAGVPVVEVVDPVAAAFDAIEQLRTDERLQ
jgi:hypothetical protein